MVQYPYENEMSAGVVKSEENKFHTLGNEAFSIHVLSDRREDIVSH